MEHVHLDELRDEDDAGERARGAEREGQPHTPGAALEARAADFGVDRAVDHYLRFLLAVGHAPVVAGDDGEPVEASPGVALSPPRP
ncbi:MAG: hypothetical protein NTY24_14915 [Mycobacterium sp.]|nr:hypothetical protein [Mycobacterium sp.]